MRPPPGAARINARSDMRQLGALLTAIGLAVGVLLGATIMLPMHLVGFSWLIGVGLAKLTFAASLGLIGGGAVLQRIAKRREDLGLIAPPGE
jgi:hypothetical protein